MDLQTAAKIISDISQRNTIMPVDEVTVYRMLTGQGMGDPELYYQVINFYNDIFTHPLMVQKLDYLGIDIRDYK